VKDAANRDIGSRENEFIQVIQTIRNDLLDIAGVTSPEYEVTLIQGCGTFAVESVISSSVPATGKLLVLINGAYGRRIVQMAQMHKIQTRSVEEPDGAPLNLKRIEELLLTDSEITHVAVVHSETSTGMINDIAAVAKLVKNPSVGQARTYIVDAMSSFGCIPMTLKDSAVDHLISSANKCLQGIPGVAFVLSQREALVACKGQARSLGLDLFSQWQGLQSNGQFRFTPPVQTLLALREAINEFRDEGGIRARADRYRHNKQILSEGMEKLGFEEFLAPEYRDASYIITSYRFPDSPRFNFTDFYSRLYDRGLVIYPGKVTAADTFRIGSIGDLHADDFKRLITAIAAIKREMHI